MNVQQYEAFSVYLLDFNHHLVRIPLRNTT